MINLYIVYYLRLKKMVDRQLSYTIIYPLNFVLYPLYNIDSIYNALRSDNVYLVTEKSSLICQVTISLKK